MAIIKKDHIMIFPFMAKGHTIPLLHLASALSSTYNLRVTVITTPANAHFIRNFTNPDHIELLVLPFPKCPHLPVDCESTDALPSFDLYPLFIHTTTLLKEPFGDLLRNLESPPLCLISDFFLYWTNDICREIGLPRVVFHGMSVFSMLVIKAAIWANSQDLPVTAENVPFHMPGTPPTLFVTGSDIPEDIHRAMMADANDPSRQFLEDVSGSDVSSWGVLVNSFSGVDSDDYVRLFESFYREENARAWLVGPLSLLSSKECAEEGECIDWLNGQEKGSVVYVSFGTQADVSPEKLDEVAKGLEESGCKYLWSVRSKKTWSPPAETKKKNGKIVRWAPQVEVLRHEATGGFVSHCGWNSVLEAVSEGVPMLTWPMIAEQHLNAKHVVEELEVGIRLAEMSGEEVRRGVRELMKGEKGTKARERAEELSKEAKMAVGDESGSSRRMLTEMVEKLRTTQRQKLRRMMKRSVSDVRESEKLQPQQVQLPFQFRDDGIV